MKKLSYDLISLRQHKSKLKKNRIGFFAKLLFLNVQQIAQVYFIRNVK